MPALLNQFPSQRQSGLMMFKKKADPKKDLTYKPLAELSDVTGRCKAEAVAFLQRHGLYQQIIDDV